MVAIYVVSTLASIYLIGKPKDPPVWTTTNAIVTLIYCSLMIWGIISLAT
jgi:hypothetical protein